MSHSPWTDDCTFECREWGCQHVAEAKAAAARGDVGATTGGTNE